MGKFPSAPLIAAAFLMTFTAAPAWAAHVTITPLGTHDGEFCRRDRALIFENHDGTRILFDPGRSVQGPSDPRLGSIDVVLLSSVHSDHLGDRFETDGDCGKGNGARTSTTPNSNTAEIAAAKNSHVFVGGEMSSFLEAKIDDAGTTSGHTHTLRHGGLAGGDDDSEVHRNLGVKIAVVTAHHSNGVSRSFLTGSNLLSNPGGKQPKGLSQHILADELRRDGLTAYAGPENGYVLEFPNGLVVYLSGDTGHTSDMALIVRDYYEPQVVIVNMGGTFSMGPEEAAFAVTKLLGTGGDGTGVETVIPEHANEASSPGALGAKVTSFITELGTLGYTVDADLTGSDNFIVPFSAVGGDFVITCTGAGVCTQAQP